MSGFGFGPGNIDCDDVLKDIYLYLDDESDENLKNRIRQHLDGCPLSEAVRPGAGRPRARRALLRW
jgi:hypothetical protein